jgi:hypothetical protein
MMLCLFGNHISCWRVGCKEGSKKCMVCHNTLNKPAHHTKDCPILKQLGLKLVKHTPANGGDAASQVSETPAPAPAPAPPVPPVPPSANGGSSCTPGAFTAVTEAENYDSGEDFNYKGKYEGSVYSGKSKSNVSIYPHASHATAEPSNNVSPPACFPIGHDQLPPFHFVHRPTKCPHSPTTQACHRTSSKPTGTLHRVHL